MTKRRQFGSTRKLPSGRWQARYPHPVTRETISAPATFRTKADADAYLARVQVEQERGEWIDPRRSSMTFQAWVDEYRTIVRKRPTTEARDRNVLNKHWIPALGPMRLSAIRPSDIQRVVTHMGTRLAPKTVQTNYGVLRTVMSAAVNDERLVRSPCRGIRLPEVRKQRRGVLSPGDVHRLASELPAQYRIVVYLCGALGLRSSEVVGLRVGDLNLLDRPATLTVRRAITEVEGRLHEDAPKTPTSQRTMGIPPFIATMLASHLASRGMTGADADRLLLVGPTGGPLRASNFRTRIWKPAVERAGLAPFTVQRLRASAQTLWGEIGMSPLAIQERAGHSDARISQEIYQQATDTLDQHSTALLEVAFEVSAIDEVADLK
jgi:integrase